MSIVAKGRVSDRPFGRTVFAIAARRFTGDLIMRREDKEYRVAWKGGRAVAARSPAPADSAARQAVAAGLVTSTQIAEVLRRAQVGSTSQLEALAEVGNLTREQLVALERRVFAYQAVRIFALDEASFELDDESALAPLPDTAPLDPRWLMYNGPRAHYDEARSIAELGVSDGATFQLEPSVLRSLGAFGFGDEEKPALAALRDHALTLEQIAAKCPRLPRARILAMLYALWCADGLAVEDSGRPAAAAENAPGPAKAPAKAATKAATKAAATRAAPAKTATPAPPDARAHGHSAVRTGRHGMSEAERKEAATTIRRLIEDKVTVLEAGADLFQLLGLARTADTDQVRASYFDLARKLHPDRLHALDIRDLDVQAQRVFAEINRAFGVLSNPKKRDEYQRMLAAGGEKAVKAQDRRAGEMAARIVQAEEQFQLGRMALRHQQFGAARDHFEQAVELNPEEGEHHAALAWATWCNSPDKEAAFDEVRSGLKKAMAMSPKSPTIFFYRAQIEKFRGRDETAIDCFRKVLDLDPGHREAQLELRLLQKRQSRKDEVRGGGLLDRLRRK